MVIDYPLMKQKVWLLLGRDNVETIFLCIVLVDEMVPKVDTRDDG